MVSRPGFPLFWSSQIDSLIYQAPSERVDAVQRDATNLVLLFRVVFHQNSDIEVLLYLSQPVAYQLKIGGPNIAILKSHPINVDHADEKHLGVGPRLIPTYLIGLANIDFVDCKAAKARHELVEYVEGDK